MLRQIRNYCHTTTLEIVKKMVTAKNFDGTLRRVNFLSVEDGKCTAEFTVEEEHTNGMGGLHGGFSATVIDLASSYALLSHPKNTGFSVSVDIHASYLKGAGIGDEVVVTADTQRIGKTLAFLTCELRNKKTNELLVSGTHTKFLLS